MVRGLLLDAPCSPSSMRRLVPPSCCLAALSLLRILAIISSVGLGPGAPLIRPVLIPTVLNGSPLSSSGRAGGMGRRVSGCLPLFRRRMLMNRPVVLCTIFPSHQLARGFPVHGCRKAIALPPPYAPHLRHQIMSPDSIRWWLAPSWPPLSHNAAAALAHAAAADPLHRFDAMSLHFSALVRHTLHLQPPCWHASIAWPPNSQGRAAILTGRLGSSALAACAAALAWARSFLALRVAALFAVVSRCGGSGWLFAS